MQFLQILDPVTHHHDWPAPPTILTASPRTRLPQSSSLTSTNAQPLDPHTSHPSGWSISIELDREGRHTSQDDHGSKWRSGEALKGTVKLAQLVETPRPITSVIVRAFWQSTTEFTTRSWTVQKKPKMMGREEEVLSGDVENAEWHRGYLDGGGEGVELWEEAAELEFLRREVEGDFPLLGGPATPHDLERRTPSTSTTSFDFTFVLPSDTKSTYSNPSPSAPADRGNLINFVRTPPPSFETPGGRGSVQWFVEVLLRTASLETTSHSTNPLDLPPPPIGTENEDDAAVDYRGLVQPTPTIAIERVTFPFEPLDTHSQDLHSSWIVPVSEAWPPAFGRDPRDELGGSTLAKEVPAPERLVEREGGADHWTTYEKETQIKSTLSLGRATGVFRSEISLAAPAMITRHSSTLLFILHLAYSPSSQKSFLSKAASPKPLVVSHVLLILYERILTRSGRAERPSMVLTELRRQTLKLWDSDGSLSLATEASRRTTASGEIEGGRRHLKILPAEERQDIKLEFDLQSTLELLPSGRPMIQVRNAGCSFRTPNIEREYIFVATVHPVGQLPLQACRVPIQLLAGDEDDAPAFEDVVAEVGGLVQGTTQRAPEVADSELPGYA